MGYCSTRSRCAEDSGREYVEPNLPIPCPRSPRSALPPPEEGLYRNRGFFATGVFPPALHQEELAVKIRLFVCSRELIRVFFGFSSVDIGQPAPVSRINTFVLEFIDRGRDKSVLRPDVIHVAYIYIYTYITYEQKATYAHP